MNAATKNITVTFATQVAADKIGDAIVRWEKADRIANNHSRLTNLANATLHQAEAAWAVVVLLVSHADNATIHAAMQKHSCVMVAVHQARQLRRERA